MSNTNEKGSSAGCLGIIWIFCVVMLLIMLFSNPSDKEMEATGFYLLLFGGIVFAPFLYAFLKDKWEK
jgi:lipoprotein signal peptidase